MQLTEEVAQKVAAAIGRPRWHSADPELLALFLQKDADENRSLVRWGIAAAVVSYVAYGLFDWFLFPDIADRLVLTRIALGITSLALIEFVARRGSPLPPCTLSQRWRLYPVRLDGSYRLLEQSIRMRSPISWFLAPYSSWAPICSSTSVFGFRPSPPRRSP